MDFDCVTVSSRWSEHKNGFKTILSGGGGCDSFRASISTVLKTVKDL